mgnify:CR=1 FL=1|jgi:hypothetical protein
MFENKGNIIPMTIPAKHSFDKSKKYPASFSRLTLSFSLPSRLSSCLFSQFPITDARYKIFTYYTLYFANSNNPFLDFQYLSGFFLGYITIYHFSNTYIIKIGI